MTLRDRLRRLEEAAEREAMTLVCPQCGDEFTVHGDVPAEFIVEKWRRESQAESYRKAPEGIAQLFAHDHDPGAFLEKGSALPFLSEQVSGIKFGGSGLSAGRLDAEDLSE